MLLDNAKRFFPNIYEKAKALKEDDSVKEYRFGKEENHLYLVVGGHAQYILSEYMIGERLRFFCSCPDFFFHSLLKSEGDTRPFCQHGLAVALYERAKLKEGDSTSIIRENEEYFLDLIVDL